MLKRPIEEVRAELLADPNTRQIAQNLNVDLNEYVEEVLYYATHDDEEPELRFVEDRDWAQHGVTPPTEGEIGEWLDRIAKGELVLDATKGKKRSDGFGITAEERRKKAINQMLGMRR